MAVSHETASVSAGGLSAGAEPACVMLNPFQLEGLPGVLSGEGSQMAGFQVKGGREGLGMA